MRGSREERVFIPSSGISSPLSSSPPPCRGRPLLLEDGDRLARPVLQLQSAQDLLRGGDFIPGFKRSEQQVGENDGRRYTCVGRGCKRGGRGMGGATRVCVCVVGGMG